MESNRRPLQAVPSKSRISGACANTPNFHTLLTVPSSTQEHNLRNSAAFCPGFVKRIRGRRGFFMLVRTIYTSAKNYAGTLADRLALRIMLLFVK
jgi:hypothetical protein